jgi:hypothetical protein
VVRIMERRILADEAFSVSMSLTSAAALPNPAKRYRLQRLLGRRALQLSSTARSVERRSFLRSQSSHVFSTLERTRVVFRV